MLRAFSCLRGPGALQVRGIAAWSRLPVVDEGRLAPPCRKRDEQRPGDAGDVWLGEAPQVSERAAALWRRAHGEPSGLQLREHALEFGVGQPITLLIRRRIQHLREIDGGVA